jgi:hypothetical protein
VIQVSRLSPRWDGRPRDYLIAVTRLVIWLLGIPLKAQMLDSSVTTDHDRVLRLNQRLGGG